MTRAEWVASGIAVIILGGYVLRDPHVRTKISLRLVAVLVVSLFLVVLLGEGTVTSLTKSISKTEVGTKASSLGRSLEDLSLLMRVDLDYSAFQRFLEYPLFGAGLGDVVHYRFLNNNATWSLDTSHLQILWKMGVIGFMAYAYFIIKAFQRAKYVFSRADDPFSRWLSVGFLSGWIGLIVLSMFSSALTKYNLNLAIAMVVAAIESEALRLEQSHKSVSE